MLSQAAPTLLDPSSPPTQALPALPPAQIPLQESRGLPGPPEPSRQEEAACVVWAAVEGHGLSQDLGQLLEGGAISLAQAVPPSLPLPGYPYSASLWGFRPPSLLSTGGLGP